METLLVNTKVTASASDQQITSTNQPLRESVKQVMENYFVNLDGAMPAALYDFVLGEVEPPFLEVVMKQVKGNQCKAAILLGISRGTLRKKLKQYQLD